MNNFSLGNLYSLTLVFTWQVKYNIITAREKHPSEYTGQEVERMEQSMTANETARLIDWLLTHGHTAEEATECIKYIASGIRK